VAQVELEVLHEHLPTDDNIGIRELYPAKILMIRLEDENFTNQIVLEELKSKYNAYIVFFHPCRG
jgi:hypothetical protein